MSDKCGWKMAPCFDTDLANFLCPGVFGQDWNADGVLRSSAKTADDDWYAMSDIKDRLALSSSKAL
jgi:hypothetical protein